MRNLNSVSITTAAGAATKTGFTYLMSPLISYAGATQIYPIRINIAPLNLVNTGGSVPATYGQVSTFAGSNQTSWTDGTGTAARFSGPSGLAFDVLGNLYVADYANNRIRKITPAAEVSTFAGTGTNSSVNGSSSSATFFNPEGIAVDTAGNVYVADRNTYSIRKISAGVVTTLAGRGTSGNIDGSGISAAFNLPCSVALDASGNLYVADYQNHNIRKITPLGEVTTFAGTGASGSADALLGPQASFNLPSGVVPDGAGNIYVADKNNGKIRKITPAGVVTTYAGASLRGTANGDALSANFNSPEGLAFDKFGNLYISDTGNYNIRKISPEGLVTTLAGSGTTGDTDGIGLAAKFSQPKGLAIYSNMLYVADKIANKIKQVGLLGYTITPELPRGLTFSNATGSITGAPEVISAATTYTITATNETGISTTTVRISTVDLTTITSFTPTSAPSGATVTITGTNFTGATAVSFGGTPAASFTVVSSTSITAVVADGSTGVVSVTTPGRTASSAATFTYTPLAVQAFTGGILQASYFNLKAAFDAINAGTHTGNITLKINTSHTLIAAAVLNASGTGSASYTGINIYPVNTGITITGNIEAPLLDLNGADNVIIDGRVNGTGSNADLIISNTSISASQTEGVSAIRFINDATSNTVKYCTLKGSYSLWKFGGGTLFFSTGTLLGNSNNVIDHNNITSVSNNARTAVSIYSSGSSIDVSNNNNTISNNNFYDFLSQKALGFGINIEDFSSAWTISGNSFYETAPFIPMTGNATFYEIIRIFAPNGNNFTVSNNFIGGSAPACGGSPFTKTGADDNGFKCMSICTAPGAVNNIQGNTITNFSYTNSSKGYWIGIALGTGQFNVGTTTGNTIGASTGVNAIVFTGGTSTNNGGGVVYPAFYGISTATSGPTGGLLTIQNNTIGAITVANSDNNNPTSFYGIYLKHLANATVSNNIIGSISTANSINASSLSLTGEQTVTGIGLSLGTFMVSENAIANMTNSTSNTSISVIGSINGIALSTGYNSAVNNNTIRDLTIANANSLKTQSASAVGIKITSSGSQTVNGNTIYNLSNTYPSFAGEVTGLDYENGYLASVSGNYIHDLSVHNSTTSATLNGIKLVGPATCSTNIISLGGNTASTLNGIYHNNTNKGNISINFNTVYLSGSPTTGALNSYAFYLLSGANYSNNFKNNIFYNGRSNNGATGGTHYAAFMVLSRGTITSDYNNYYAPGVGGKLGSYVGVDKTSVPIVTAQDAHSISVNPLFTSAGGSLATDYQTGVRMPGITLEATDYAGTTRAATPTMGAYENNVVTLTAQSITFGSFAAKTYGGLDFSPGATASSGLTVGYVSSNTAVATIVNGQIHLVGAGTSTITASQAGNSSFDAATPVTQLLTVSKANQTITLSPLPVGSTTLAAFVGAIQVTATASSGVSVVIALGSGSVATLNGTNQLVSIGATGTVTINLSADATANFNSATGSYTFDVVKTPQTISFGSIPSKTVGDGDFGPGATAGSSLTVGYISSNTNVATIVSGNIHVVSAGTTTITASQSGNGTFDLATDVSQSLTVNQGAATIVSFTPTSAEAGATVTITGTNFTGTTAVSFGGASVSSFTVVDATTITAVVATGTTGTVSVTTPQNIATLAGYTFVTPAALTLTSFSPVSAAGGTTITISGTSFLATTAVRFGGTPAQSFVVADDNTINAVVASGTSGSVSVTAGGTVSLAGFTFIAPAAPTISGFTPTSGGSGTTVTISGTDFTGATSVKFGGTTAASFVVADKYTITAVVATGTTGVVSVVTPLGTAPSVESFTYIAAPAISSFTPVTAGTGTTVTITGSNFDDATEVSFGGTAAGSFTVVSPTSITATVASGTTGSVSLTTPGGTANLSGFTYIGNLVWTGSADSDWNTQNNWNPGSIPVSTDNILIPNVTNMPVATDVTIASGAALTIASQASLSITGTLTNNSTGGVVIQSDASGTGSLIANTAAGSGTAIAGRYMSGSSWHMTSSPVSGQSVSNFLTANSAIPTKGSDRGMMDYSESANDWNAYYITGVGNITPGKGFCMRTGTDAAVTFTGALNASTINVATIKTADSGWNCIGNPYTSAIYVNRAAELDNNFITINSAILDPSYSCIYMWDETASTSQYQIVNQASDATIVSTGQAFIVKTATDGNNVAFTPAMQVHQSTLTLKSASQPWPEIKLKAQVDNKTVSTSVKFIAGTTNGLDVGYDAGLFNTDPSLAIYTRLADDNGVDFALQCLPNSNFKGTIIPVGLNSKTGGNVVFSAEMINLASDCKAILEDKLTNMFTDLSQGTYKAAIVSNSILTDRFRLHTSEPVSKVPPKPDPTTGLNVYAVSDVEIHVVGQVSKDAIATLFDVQGKAVQIEKLLEGSLNVIPVAGFSTGMYLLLVSDGARSQTFKIILKK